MRLMSAMTTAALLITFPVCAQQTPAPPTHGPLILERVESRFVVAPDYKITELDGDVAHLAGGYAGLLTDDTVFVGGALYSATNRSDDFKLTYGGLALGWNVFPAGRVQFGARGLVGLGRATLGSDVNVLRFDDRNVRFGSRSDRTDRLGTAVPATVRVLARDDFFVFEPQLTAVAKLTDHIGLQVGAGYRVTAYADRLRDRVNGPAGSIALQLGGW